ncbi:F-box only protein 21-like isoform X1 [Ptychodera flava]|uniref:F-box only protein 21-like isoform X1 n=1 Tax=Ptychodera flava TaxID=63121 RepID=UPI003969F784
MEDCQAEVEDLSPLHLLADEIVELILCNTQLDHADVVSFSSTCTRFQAISTSQELWKRKILQRWPTLSELAQHEVAHEDGWFDLFKLRFKIGRTVQHLVKRLSPLYYHLDDVSNEGFAGFKELFLKDDFLHSRFIQDELLAIINDENQNDQLTKKYYAGKAIRYVQHHVSSTTWRDFLAKPNEEQSLETGAILLAQWCQPATQIQQVSIQSEFDQLALKVQVELRNRCPDHPVCFQQIPCRVEMNEDQRRRVVECLNTVLFIQEGYKGNEQDYYDKLNSYINKVIERKTGIPITLSILYTSVAKRLGVSLQPVNFPNHFLMRLHMGPWNEENAATNSADDFIYIDVFNKGRLLHASQCLEISPAVASTTSHYFNSCTHKAVFIRMASNLLRINPHRDDNSGLRNALELYLVLCPDDIEVKLLQARVYLHLNINLQEVLVNLRDISTTSAVQESVIAHLSYRTRVRELLNRASQTAEIRAKKRDENSEVKFSVGMIMKHKRYNYVCLIYGWDSTCKMPQEWIMQMGVYNLPHKDKQPFYNVLVEDGTNRYAAQENLEFAPQPHKVMHPDVGRYFNKYCGNFYMANSELGKRYPDDLPVTVAEVSVFYYS